MRVSLFPNARNFNIIKLRERFVWCNWGWEHVWFVRHTGHFLPVKVKGSWQDNGQRSRISRNVTRNLVDMTVQKLEIQKKNMISQINQKNSADHQMEVKTWHKIWRRKKGKLHYNNNNKLIKLLLCCCWIKRPRFCSSVHLQSGSMYMLITAAFSTAWSLDFFFKCRLSRHHKKSVAPAKSINLTVTEYAAFPIACSGPSMMNCSENMSTIKQDFQWRWRIDYLKKLSFMRSLS